MKIKDINLFFEKGLNCKKGNQGDILFIPSGAVFPEKIKEDKCHRTFDAENISKDKLIRKNDILFNSGGVGTLGRVGFYDEDIWSGDAICDPFVFIIRSNDKKLYSKYLFYYFQTDQVKRNIVKYTVGSTGITSIRKKDILNFSIILPAIELQKIIVQILDEADNLRQKRKEQLALLDDYLKSVFLDIFGDPRSDRRWYLVDFGDVIDVLTDYHANGSYEILRKHVKLKSKPDYALMVRTTDLESRNFTDDVKYISKEAYNFLEKSKIYGEEIIINKIGSAGNVYLMPNLNRPVSLGMNAFLLRFKKTSNNIFIFYLLSSDYGKSIIESKVKGAVTKTIRKDAVRSLKIPLPPLELQIQFVSIVKQIEKTKQKMRDSLEEMDNHFNSLMQRYF